MLRKCAKHRAIKMGFFAHIGHRNITIKFEYHYSLGAASESAVQRARMGNAERQHDHPNNNAFTTDFHIAVPQATKP